MSVAAKENATRDQIETDRPAPRPTLVIDRFDHWHNNDAVMLRPTSITWGDGPTPTKGRAA